MTPFLNPTIGLIESNEPKNLRGADAAKALTL
jgi:hypothetical protein